MDTHQQNRRDNLEDLIRDGYKVVYEYEQILQTGRPEERLNAQRMIDQQWVPIKRYLADYRACTDDPWPEDIVAIARTVPRSSALVASRSFGRGWLRPMLLKLVEPKMLLCAITATVAGGLVWNVINRLLGWSFYMGGSGNEPTGLAAFLSGTITVFSVVGCLFWAYAEYIQDERALFKCLVTLGLCAVLGGIGTMLFYSLGLRGLVESTAMGYGGREISLAFVWSLTISILTGAPLWIVHRSSLNRWGWLLLPVALAVSGAILGVFFSLIFDLPTSWISQLRGFLASALLRLGLFWGLALAFLMHIRSDNQWQWK